MAEVIDAPAVDSQALVAVVEHDMRIARAPQIVLDEAKKAAQALTDVIRAKPKHVTFNGETYLEYEDWQTVARFYGLTAKVVSTTFVEYGDAKGFEARAVALRADGLEVSAAEALCLNDEPNWARKPLFQLKSMAQTRAAAKALRNCLSWVVVLAGYKPTPAEEMDGMASRTPAPASRNVAAPPRERENAAVADAGEPATPSPAGTVRVRSVDGKSTRNPNVTRYEVTTDDGVLYTTIKDAVAYRCREAMEGSVPVAIQSKETRWGHEIVSVELTGAVPDDDDVTPF